MHDRKQSYEGRIRPEATVDDLDIELAGSFLRGTADGNAESTIAELERYGLITSTGEGWQVTNAALLLFAREPADRWHPQAGIAVFRVTGTRRLPGRTGNVNRAGRADPPLARAVDEIRRITGAQIGSSDALRDIFYRDLPEYPDEAWQEALDNVIAHRDYELQDRRAEIWFFDDRMEVVSPGELPEPVTLEALREGNAGTAARNPLMARVLADAGYLRAEGRGFGRMRASMAASFLRKPEFEEKSALFSVILFKEPTFETAGPGWSYLVRRLPISGDQKRILLARPDGFSHVDYQQLNSVHEDEAKKRVQELVERDIVCRDFDTGDEVTRCYLTAELDEARWFLEDRLPGLREHFRKDPWLRSSDYRSLFEISVRDAGKEIAQLVELGFLHPEGRGRGTRYMPTAALRG